MEYALRGVTSRMIVSGTTRLNPYSNGICAMREKKFETATDGYVLILILMEYAQ